MALLFSEYSQLYVDLWNQKTISPDKLNNFFSRSYSNLSMLKLYTLLLYILNDEQLIPSYHPIVMQTCIFHIPYLIQINYFYHHPVINNMFIFAIKMQFFSLLKNILITCISSMVVIAMTLFYRTKLHSSSIDVQPFTNAVQFISNALAEQTDLDQHHFQQCRECGFPLAISKDVSYCRIADTYKLLHPNVVLEDLVIFRDYGGQDLARKIMRETMFDGMPRLEQNRPQNLSLFSNLPLSTSVLYPYAKNYLRTHTLGFAGGCMFQKYYHVPGQEDLALKSNQSTHFNNYIRSLEKQQKSNDCVEDAKYMKQTFRYRNFSNIQRLWIAKECQEIFHIMQSEEYISHLRKKGILHIFKTNQHLGNGVLLIDFQNERTIRKWYENGNNCGRNFSQHIIQEYVVNPYLYNGHKMEFRSYFAIASTNPPILYGYKVALIKQCALKFNLRDFTRQSHICNTAVTKSHKQTSNNENQDDLYIDWNLEELQDMLLSQGRINSTTWLDEYLMPQIYRKVIHLFLSVQDFLFADSRVGEFFGVDFIMDNDLRLWLFEANRNPNFLAVTQGRLDKFDKLITDMIDLEWKYIRSKYRRIKSFVLENLSYFGKDYTNTTHKTILKKQFLQLQRDKLESDDFLNNSRLELIFVGDRSLGAQQSKYLRPECLIN